MVVSLTSRMRNMWSLVFYLGRAQPPLWIVLLLIFWNFCPQGMNSNYSPWGWGQIYLLPQIYIVNIDKKVLKRILANYFSVQFSSVAQSCPTFCDPMNCSTPGLPVHHQLPEFTQTHVHRVCDAIQPSHLLSSPSPPAPNPSQHQSLFQ